MTKLFGPNDLPPDLVIDAELARRRYLRDPVAWHKERLGRFLWSKQRQICQSVRDYRFTAVHSAHATGKSVVAAGIGHLVDRHTSAR